MICGAFYLKPFSEGEGSVRRERGVFSLRVKNCGGVVVLCIYKYYYICAINQNSPPMKRSTALLLNFFMFVAMSMAFGPFATLPVVGLGILFATAVPSKVGQHAYAKIQFGMMMTDASGKLGGQVFSKNRAGAYVRTKVTPVNPRTVYQQTARFALSSFSQAWSNLTQNQRDAWNAAVTAFARHDVFGNLRNPSGKNLYVRLNVNLFNTGQAQITDPPVPIGLSEITGFAVTAASPGTVAVAWTSGPVPVTETWLLEATKPVNVGRSFVKNLYRVIAVLASAQTTPYAAGTAYTTKFGTFSAGQRISARVTQIQNNTGQNGVPISATCITT